MEHCRFQNTWKALEECQEHLGDGSLSKAESHARIRLVELCQQITWDYEDEIDEMKAVHNDTHKR